MMCGECGKKPAQRRKTKCWKCCYERLSPLSKFIKTTWTGLNVRCGGNGKYYRPSRKNEVYANTFIRFTRQQFREWCEARASQILSLTRPSIDRIDKSGDYTFDNMQVIELVENMRKDRLTFTETAGVCFRCKETKPIDSFVIDRRRLNGRTNVCKPCERQRKTDRYQLKKGDSE